MTRLHHRTARMDDFGQLQAIYDRVMAQSMQAWLNDDQVAASRAVMGIDTQLIVDATYFVVFDGSVMAGCGGWSRRATLYGGDASIGRDARLLDPRTEPARVRAMYTDPAFVRRGVGTLILSLCEMAALAQGFGSVELAATRPGLSLYRARGYVVIDEFDDDRGGTPVPLARMQKILSA